MEEANDKVKRPKQAKRIAREEIPEMEAESCYGTAKALLPFRPRNLRRRTGNSPFTTGVLEDPLPPHFKPVNYEYDGSMDPDDHMAKFENMALLHQYTEGVKCRVFSTTLVGAAQQWFKKLRHCSIASFDDLYEAFSRQFASSKRSAKSSLHLMMVKQMDKESLREYVAKFNMVALETPGVDAKIKVHAFIQGLRSGSVFDSLVMNEPKDFRDLLERITPYINLEEARTTRREEVDMKDKRNPKWRENEIRAEVLIGECDVRIRPHATSTRGRYDNRSREYHPRDRAPPGFNENGYGPLALAVRAMREMPDLEWIPFTRSIEEMWEVAKNLPRFRGPNYITQQIRGPPSQWVCRYHNQYGHNTERCRTLRLALENLVREGYLLEIVDKSGGTNPAKEQAKRAEREDEPRLLPPSLEIS